MKHLVKKARQKVALTLSEVRSRRDRRRLDRQHRKQRARLAAEEALFHVRSAEQWQSD